MSNYTPGPWRVRENDGDHWGLREVVGPSLSVRGFTVATNVSLKMAAQVEADARLIAAAPEMLRLISDLYAGLQTGQGRFASLDDDELAEAIDDEMSSLLGGVDWQGKREQ